MIIKIQLTNNLVMSLIVATTDLKIDWIWHLIINVLQILKPEVMAFATPPIQVIGPTLLYYCIRKSQLSRFYSFYTLSIGPKFIPIKQKGR